VDFISTLRYAAKAKKEEQKAAEAKRAEEPDAKPEAKAGEAEAVENPERAPDEGPSRARPPVSS
jgi:hypothetical protein